LLLWRWRASHPLLGGHRLLAWLSLTWGRRLGFGLCCPGLTFGPVLGTTASLFAQALLCLLAAIYVSLEAFPVASHQGRLLGSWSFLQALRRQGGLPAPLLLDLAPGGDVPRQLLALFGLPGSPVLGVSPSHGLARFDAPIGLRAALSGEALSGPLLGGDALLSGAQHDLALSQVALADDGLCSACH
jgi:hypothetical protein